MKAVVLGAGVVGVASAYFLAKAGCEVTLLDRRDTVAAEASAVNAGAIAPGHSFSWASPRAPMILFESLFVEHKALKLHFTKLLDPALVSWGVRFLRECTRERAERNTLIKLRLCQYSQQVLDGLVEKEGIDYDRGDHGMLYLYRDSKKLQAGMTQMQLLIDHGQEMEFLDADGCARVEPALEPVKQKLAGAIYATTDSTGDPVKFTGKLATLVQSMGGILRLGTTIKGLTATGDTIESVMTDKGIITGDLYVLALGSYSPVISQTVGVKLPIYPVKGLSITAPLLNERLAPRAGGVDEDLLVGWSRMGDRLRMTSTADFTGYDTRINRKDYSTIFATARSLFPEAADYDKAELTSGLRPMTPGGPPIIGRGKHANLWYNTGHGHMGWTMACGSGRIVADLICGAEPEISMSGLGVHA